MILISYKDVKLPAVYFLGETWLTLNVAAKVRLPSLVLKGWD